MHTEEFILIPKRMFICKQPAKSEILNIPIYQQKAAQSSLFQGNQSTDTEKSAYEVGTVEPMIEANEITEAHKEQKETSETPSNDNEIETILKKQKI